jgi:hypothetical protein
VPIRGLEATVFFPYPVHLWASICHPQMPHANFGELRKAEVQLPRILLPRLYEMAMLNCSPVLYHA